MLENTIEHTHLTTPADAIELSMDDLEEVNGAWCGWGGGWGGSCFGGWGGSCFGGWGSGWGGSCFGGWGDWGW